jgi:EAL domain-containing protein (putative c-di-GMP-specific phosphodiesterase class I)
MSFPVLDKYLAILSQTPQAGTSVWLDAQGRAEGKYFNCTLTSAFQPIRELNTRRIVGHEAYARSTSVESVGLSLWKILDHAANDDESVELDRLCRMLHAINFFRQTEAGGVDLYLSVHGRLLEAVSTNHGMAFRRILEGLGLPLGKVVLQLPEVKASQGWLLSHVTDNYRHNGFRFAVNVNDAAQALQLPQRVRPDVIKIDARLVAQDDNLLATLRLLEDGQRLGMQIIFKHVENEKVFRCLQQVGRLSGVELLVQGYLLDAPHPSLRATEDASPINAEAGRTLAFNN